MRTSRLSALALTGSILASLLLASCGSDEAPAQESTASQPSLDDPAVAAALVKADAFDGTEDKVVSRCVTCSLRMDGLEAHPSEIGDYTFHLCSADCLERFEGGKEAALMGVRYPK